MQLILKELLNFLSIELTVLLTAALSIIELRGAIPGGISLGLSPLYAANTAHRGCWYSFDSVTWDRRGEWKYSCYVIRFEI